MCCYESTAFHFLRISKFVANHRSLHSVKKENVTHMWVTANLWAVKALSATPEIHFFHGKAASAAKYF